MKNFARENDGVWQYFLRKWLGHGAGLKFQMQLCNGVSIKLLAVPQKAFMHAHLETRLIVYRKGQLMGKILHLIIHESRSTSIPKRKVDKYLDFWRTTF